MEYEHMSQMSYRAQKCRPESTHQDVIYQKFERGVRNYYRNYHYMETLSVSLVVLCQGTTLGTGRFPSQRASNADIWCFFDISLSELLSKQLSCQHLVILWCSWLLFCSVASQRPVLLQQSDAVASLSANGSAAFKESYAPIGLNSCDSVMLQ